MTRGLPPADSDGFALEAVFAEATPLAVVPADPESNVDNYEHGKKLRDVPAEVPIHIGMKVVLTKNLNKGIGFVNGMAATVLGMDGGNIIVKKDRGRRLAVHPWTSEDKVVHFPLRVGYTSTLHKVQGATSRDSLPGCAQYACGSIRRPQSRAEG